MAEIIAIVQEEDLLSVTTSTGNLSGVESLGLIGDVNVNNLINGSVLVYKTSTNKWTSTTTLDAQNMEGGEF